jgi:hypothetical protein
MMDCLNPGISCIWRMLQQIISGALGFILPTQPGGEKTFRERCLQRSTSAGSYDMPLRSSP